MIKGFIMDDERLKNPEFIFGEDYFDEMLERIRNIRSSEKITDIYSLCSIDYDKDSEITKNFLKRFRIICTMQLLVKQLQSI